MTEAHENRNLKKKKSKNQMTHKPADCNGKTELSSFAHAVGGVGL